MQLYGCQQGVRPDLVENSVQCLHTAIHANFVDRHITSTCIQEEMFLKPKLFSGPNATNTAAADVTGIKFHLLSQTVLLSISLNSQFFCRQAIANLCICISIFHGRV